MVVLSGLWFKLGSTFVVSYCELCVVVVNGFISTLNLLMFFFLLGCYLKGLEQVAFIKVKLDNQEEFFKVLFIKITIHKQLML